MSFARIRALALVGVLVLAAAVLTVMALTRGSGGTEAQASTCPSGYVLANMKLPNDNAKINLNVYNATDKIGLANGVKLDFEYRRFHVAKTGNNPLKKPIEGVALLRFGPQSVGAAYVVNAYFLNNGTLQFDPNRTDDSVDVILGPGFKQLATQTEVNQAFTVLAGNGGPAVPSGACESGN